MAGLDSRELGEDTLALVRRTLDGILGQALDGIGPLPPFPIRPASTDADPTRTTPNAYRR